MIPDDKELAELRCKVDSFYNWNTWLSKLRPFTAIPLGFLLSATTHAQNIATLQESSQGRTVQTPTTPDYSALTLKRAIELALQNSKDLQLARIQAQLADHSASI